MKTSEAKNKIEAILHNWTKNLESRVHIFICKDQLELQSLDQLLQEYVDKNWLILVRKPKGMNDVFCLTFTKNKKLFNGKTNPEFVNWAQ